VKAGNLVKHRGKVGLGTVVDIDGLRLDLKIVLVMWADQRGIKYEPVNELRVISEGR